MSGMQRYSRADVLLILVLLFLGVSSPLLMPVPQTPNTLLVSTPEGVTRVSLETSDVYELTGSNGPTIIEVEDGRARIVRSSCSDNRRHWAEGWISMAGQSLACVPNEIVMDLSGSGFDSVMR